MSSVPLHAPSNANAYDRISVSPLAGALGAEIGGVDISRPVDSATFAEIRRAWDEHLVVFFRGQSLDDDALVAFGRRFARKSVRGRLTAKQATDTVAIS
jgi:taurine dioxygenase